MTEEMFAQVQALGGEIDYSEVSKIDKIDDFVLTTTSGEYRYKCIIVATGTTERRLGIEDNFIGKGVSFCAVCDGNFYKGKRVAVVGGGNTAVHDALYLSKICSEVYLLHRRKGFRADNVLLGELATRGNVKILTDVVIESLSGQRHLENININNLITAEKSSIEVDGLFVAVGVTPNSQLVEGLCETKDGYIVTDSKGNTSLAGLFSAGDVTTTPLKQVVTACANGAISAESVAEYIDKIS
ncbi:MAG: FAD-dependent oxidoreductase [Clostridia bacterium]